MATQAVELEDRRQEVSKLEAELSALRIRLATEESDRTALETERAELAEKIALGEVPAAKAGAVGRRIEEADARITGFRSVIARKQSELDARWPELRTLEAEHRLATRRAEVETLRQKGSETVERINQKITELLTEDFVAFDQIRDKLAELGDAGGSETARQLVLLVGSAGESNVLTHLIDQRRWMEGNVWNLRSDIILTLRNLWPPKKC